ncbi:cellulose synthase subunit BcsC-related outer membrane protein [Erwinia rhapontici]|uniref:cellulose synthase subunit BcsC-related outer membrane protein n=1 Tax=Erwinia rhapontici TaxID=55212 RepID=UPI003B9FDE73
MRPLHGLLLPVLLLPLSAVFAADSVAPVAWLLQQVRTGEATNKYDLVAQSLYRLDKIAPDNPDVLAAKLRLALRQGDQASAARLMSQLNQIAPSSAATRQAAASMLLITPEGRQQFQQARLLAASGRLEEARAAWDQLFHGAFPSTDIALEYWRLVARLPGQQALALAEMQALDGQAPGNAELQQSITQIKQDVGRTQADTRAAALGARGQALTQAGNRAAATTWFRQAINAAPEGDDVSKWQSLLRSNQYWLAIEQGDKALAQGDTRAAERYYLQARPLDPRDGYARIGLGDVALARKDNSQAEQHYREALRVEPGNTTAVRRLAAVYQQQSPQRALDFLNTLPVAQQRALGDTLASLRSSALSDEADRLGEQGKWSQAVAKYRQAQPDAPDDVWLNYRYAGALRENGQTAAAEAVMAAMARRQPQDPAQVYTYGLWLSGRDNDDAALKQLNTLPKARWTPDIQALSDRLESQRQLDQIDAQIAQQQPADAQRLLQALPPAVSAASLSNGRRVANAWASIGETDRARTQYAGLKAQAEKESPSELSALVLRDAARLEAAQGQPAAALNDYRQVMVASGIAAQPPVDNDTFTRLTRNDVRDDWLKRSIRSDSADLYKQQDTVFTLEEDYSRNKGTGGISDFTARTTMLQADTPWDEGRSWLRLDNVDVSAGTFSRNSSGNITENFGTCANDDAQCSRDFKQHQNGTSIGAGYRSDRWSADLGTTPLGFEVTNWVGGLTWNTDIDEVGVSLTASRRPISSSLLAFAGARDPNPASGKTWGGVVATGGAIGLSYDRGEAHGIWADISAHQIGGTNVADNSRERLMSGYYYKWINEDNRRATIGLNGMLWHYAKDLSDYSLGQGGYYSPQRYASVSVPVTFRQRTENWSFDLGGSVSLSHSKTRAQPRYPLSFGDLTRDNPPGSDGGGSGVGYTLQALVERRLSSHWTLGLGVDIQQAKDYTPSHGLMYLRYSMAGWQGDLDMPPQPLIPYADFK